MKSTKDAVALACLAGIGLGIALTIGSLVNALAGIGAGLLVVSALVLIYLILPDQSPGGPPQ